MFRNKNLSYILKYKFYRVNIMFFKKAPIYFYENNQYVYAHKGMLYATIRLFPHMQGFRLGEFILNRKFFKRPLKLKIKKR